MAVEFKILKDQIIKGKKITFVVIALDRSGSMSKLRHNTVQMYNSYIQGLKEDGYADNTYVSIVVFNHVAEVLVQPTLVSEIPELLNSQYRPDGGTALNEAVATSLLEADVIKSIFTQQGVETQIMFAILTDGDERDSNGIYKNENGGKELVKKMIGEYEVKGWKINFIGIGLDDVQVQRAAQDYGIGDSVSIPADARGMFASTVHLRNRTTGFVDLGSDQDKLEHPKT